MELGVLLTRLSRRPSSLTRNCSPSTRKRLCSKSLMASSPVCWPELIRASRLASSRAAWTARSSSRSSGFSTMPTGFSVSPWCIATTSHVPLWSDRVSTVHCSLSTAPTRRPLRALDPWHRKHTPRRRRQNGSVMSGLLMLGPRKKEVKNRDVPTPARQDRGVSHDTH